MSTLKANLGVTPQEIFTTSSTQGTTLGALATSGDGRFFKYVLAGGTTLAVGKVQSAPAETTTWQDLDIAATSVGDTSITTTSTLTVTANALAGGYVTVTNGTGIGYTYGIKSNPAATSAVVTIQLSDPIQVASPNTVDIDFIASPFSGVVLNAATTVAIPVGVAIYPITNAQYGWIQTGGPVSVLADASAPTIGANVFVSDDTDGAVGLYETDAAGYAFIGQALTGMTSAEYGMVYLNLN